MHLWDDCRATYDDCWEDVVDERLSEHISRSGCNALKGMEYEMEDLQWHSGE
jgi:hypothetical protein